MGENSAVRWFVKCSLTAVTVLLACGVATAWLGNGLQLSSTTTHDGTLITFNRYAHESAPDVVLVGSSVTFRLKEEYFATPGLRNLAIAGGSPVTGLEIVARQRRLPRIILVETNVLSRSIDTALVERYSTSDRAEPLFIRPVRAAVAAYENWLHAPLNHAQMSLALSQLLKQPPGEFDNHIYAERALEQSNSEDPTVNAQMNAKRIRELIPVVEQRGARLFLYELPYSASIEASRAAKITRDIIRAEFPDPDRWLHIEYARSDLRWRDSVHLDDRSALIISQSIDRTLSSLPAAR